ncbi:MAG: hypothetical protein NWF11_05345 [Candidatus Bathyarchaeota archaeon]|nr:hypothetical protein [Candidatus Bathyarchaeota archaeon]
MSDKIELEVLLVVGQSRVEINIGRCIVKRAVVVRRQFDLGWKH